jgi:ribonuclease HI
MHIEIYTDGSATVKEKPGGWAYVLIIDGQKYAECAGHMEGASNNDAEMEAAIQGLAAVLKLTVDKVTGKDEPAAYDRKVTLVSDSQLILGWADGTYRFKQQNKIDKYNQLKFLVSRLGAKTRWVEGHSGDEHNERCDKLANEARLGISKQKDREEALATGKTLIGTKKSGTLCVWYKNTLKIIDLETNIVENYSRNIHGSRGGTLEIREEKSR